MTRVIAAAEWGGEFDGALDPINSLFRFPPIWELSLFGVDLSINRTILIAWFMTLVCGTLFVLAFRNPTVVPGKLQNLAESAIDFVRQIALDIIGPKGLKFVPLLTTMFVFIFFMNVSKITPFLMLPPTSRMAWPAFLAIIAWLVYVGVGIANQGLFTYFKEIAIPPGVPKILLLILTPIEIISNLVLRPFTLAVRLFANMVAGHILVVITLVTIHVFLPSPAGFPIGIFALVASPLVFGFELLIILTPIEIISNLILRPFTLAVRLFANMVAGHILVVITLVTIHVFLPSPAGFPIGIFALVASPLVFGFELLIIGLQAYIFTMLTAVYISTSVEAAH